MLKQWLADKRKQRDAALQRKGTRDAGSEGEGDVNSPEMCPGPGHLPMMNGTKMHCKGAEKNF